MRIYIPLVADDLLAPTISTGGAVQLSVPDGGLAGDELELLSDEALLDAAFASLERCQEAGSAPARMVAVADFKGPIPSEIDWRLVESIMADTDRGRRIARNALASENQGDTDSLVEELFDQPLSWFDVSERQKLAVSLARVE